MHSQNCQKAFSMQTCRGCCWEDQCGELAVLAASFLPRFPGPTLFAMSFAMLLTEEEMSATL